MSNSSSAKSRAEMRVEVGDLGLRLHAEAAVRLGDDVVLALVEVVLVLDVADDLLQHVLDRDEARHAAVLVDDDRDVVAVGAELAQQHVEALRLRHEHRGPQRLAQVEALRVRVVAQQLLREQDADDVVLVLADHREARVLGLERRAAGTRAARRRSTRTSICARGIMMSRTVISDTCSTPSIIDSASASSSLRSNAPCRSSSSSSRSSGSRVRSADRRSSSVGLSGALSARRPSRLRQASRARVRDRDSPARARIAVSRASIARGIGAAFVVVALQVQHAVDDEVRVVMRRSVLPCARASSRTTGAHSTMSPATRRRIIVHERRARWSRSPCRGSAR